MQGRPVELLLSAQEPQFLWSNQLLSYDLHVATEADAHIPPHQKETNASNAGLVARAVQTDKQLQQIKPGLRGSKAEPGNSTGRTLPTRVFAMASTLELYLMRTA